MASTLSGLPPFDDPEQWWQPDYQDDPDYDATLDPYSPFCMTLEGALINDDIWGPSARIREAIEKAGWHLPVAGLGNYSVSKEDRDPTKHIWHTHISVKEEKVRPAVNKTVEEIMTGIISKVSAAIKPLAKVLEPVIEAQGDHWKVCHHRPRCKKPGPGAAFNEPVSQKRRPRKSNR